VLAQLVLFALIVGAAFVHVYWPDAVVSILTLLGLLAGLAGLVLCIAGALALGAAFSPLPRPRAGGRVARRGVYRAVRHPVYGGVLLLALGWSLAEAPLGLIPTAVLAVLFDLKARLEEAWLVERHPDYAEYRARTTRRFVPGLY
jgi:protein-S-isoprenylcysteine O-methyltransferase Ste14